MAYSLVFDAVYTPRETRLLKEAKEAGATVVSGIEMFIRQAMNQFSLFTDSPGMWTDWLTMSSRYILHTLLFNN